MRKDRRRFLGASLALGAAPFLKANTLDKVFSFSNDTKPLNILILGGTSFLGPHQIAYAIDRGHRVSTFTRGKTNPKVNKRYFENVESLIGDRENNLDALKNRRWDVVIDNSGRRTQWTEDTAKLLKENVGFYMYTSSISVYYPYTGSDFSESREVVLEVPEGVTENQKYTYEYGVMKANSELAAIKHFGENRSIIVRPALIVGPGDRTDRFPYWVARMKKGGDIIIPGQPNEVIQYIDVRDLAEWMIRLAENKTAGTFNGSGPGFKMTTNAFVHGVHACFNSPVSYTQINDVNFLQENEIIGIQPWVIQLPEYAGMSQSDNTKAIEAGLTFRPLADTVKDTDTWWTSDAVSEERRNNILNGEKSFMKREKDILKNWKAHLNKIK